MSKNNFEVNKIKITKKISVCNCEQTEPPIIIIVRSTRSCVGLYYIQCIYIIYNLYTAGVVIYAGQKFMLI